MTYAWVALVAFGIFVVYDTSRGMSRWEWCAAAVMLALVAVIVAIAVVVLS